MNVNRCPCRSHRVFIANCESCIRADLMFVEDTLEALTEAGRTWAGPSGTRCADGGLDCPECNFMRLLDEAEALFKEEI